MSNYARNWLRTSLIFSAISITSLIPHPLDAKGMGLEPPWTEFFEFFGKDRLLSDTNKLVATAGGAFVTIDHVAQTKPITRNVVIYVAAILAVFGVIVAVVCMRPGRHNETGKASIKPPNGKPIRRKSSVTAQKASPTLPNPS
jgi:hypothetical protein